MKNPKFHLTCLLCYLFLSNIISNAKSSSNIVVQIDKDNYNKTKTWSTTKWKQTSTPTSTDDDDMMTTTSGLRIPTTSTDDDNVITATLLPTIAPVKSTVPIQKSPSTSQPLIDPTDNPIMPTMNNNNNNNTNHGNRPNIGLAIGIASTVVILASIFAVVGIWWRRKRLRRFSKVTPMETWNILNDPSTNFKRPYRSSSTSLTSILTRGIATTSNAPPPYPSKTFRYDRETTLPKIRRRSDDAWEEYLRFMNIERPYHPFYQKY